jgi:WD40 repeat protein
MAGVGYKWVRIYDLRVRESSNNPAFSAASRHVHGLYGDCKDSNYFASYSDDGAVVVWDRRMGKSQALTEPVLNYGRNSTDEANLGSIIVSLRYSPDKSGVFGLLNNMGGLKIYQNGKMYESYPSEPSPTEPTQRHHKMKGRQNVVENEEKNGEILFTKRVIDSMYPNWRGNLC